MIGSRCPGSHCCTVCRSENWPAARPGRDESRRDAVDQRRDASARGPLHGGAPSAVAAERGGPRHGGLEASLRGTIGSPEAAVLGGYAARVVDLHADVSAPGRPSCRVRAGMGFQRCHCEASAPNFAPSTQPIYNEQLTRTDGFP